MRHLELTRYWALACVLFVAAGSPATEPVKMYHVSLVVESELPFPNVPMDPMIDFASLISKVGASGVLDANTIQVVEVKTGERPGDRRS